MEFPRIESIYVRRDLSKHMANSTVIQVEPTSIPTLLSFRELSKPKDRIDDFVDALLKLSINGSFITFEKIATATDLPHQTILRYCKKLVLLEWAESKFASKVEGLEPSHWNLRCYTIKSVPNKKAPNNHGKSKVKRVNEMLDSHGLEALTKYSETKEPNLPSFGLQAPAPVRSLYAPGTTLREQTLSRVHSSNGMKNNSANSVFGVINAYDEKVLDALLTLTTRYVARYPAMYFDSVDKDNFIPIWIDDIVNLCEGAEPSPSLRLETSLSLLRIEHTSFKLHTDGLNFSQFGAEAEGFTSGYLPFSFLDKVIVPSQPNEEFMSSSSSDDYQRRAKNAFGSDFPFIGILISWNKEFFKKLLRDKTLLPKPIVSLRIPPLLAFLLNTIKQDFYNGKSFFRQEGYTVRYYSSDGSVIDDNDHKLKEKAEERHEVVLMLDTVLQLTWPNEDIGFYLSTVKGIFREINYKIGKTNPESLEKISDNVVAISHEGIKLLFNCFRLKDSSRKGNLTKTEVGIQLSPSAIHNISKSSIGSTEKQKKNLPQIPNPIRIVDDLDQVDMVRHSNQLMQQTQAIQSSLKNKKVKKYIAEFSILGEEFLLSRYMVQSEARHVMERITELVNCNAIESQLFVDDLIADRLIEIPGVEQQELLDLSDEIGVSVSKIVKYISTRTRFLKRVQTNNYEEVRSHFS